MSSSKSHKRRPSNTNNQTDNNQIVTEEEELNNSNNNNQPNKKGPAAPEASNEEELVFEDPYEDEREEEEVEGEDDEGEGQDEDEAEDEDEQIQNQDDLDIEVDGKNEETKKKPTREKLLGPKARGQEKEKVDPSKKVYQPGVDEFDPAEEEMDYDSTAYTMLHRLKMDWPALSFDIVRDNLGAIRTKFPHTMYLVSGSQADQAVKNKISILKVSELHKTINDDLDSEDEENDDKDLDNPDDLDDDPVLEDKSFSHNGSVNRIRIMPQNNNIIAAWSDNGSVNIWNIESELTSLEHGASGSAKPVKNPKKDPLFSFKQAQGSEGYALDWSSRVPGKLVTGDCNRLIYLWNPKDKSGEFAVEKNPFKGHVGSVEDLAWSPGEDTVFASCSTDKTVRIWDSRVKEKCAAWVAAHRADVNVISWNKLEQHLLASGGDDNSIKVWDLRAFTSKSFLCHFTWHKGPITSIEWHPSDESVLAASSDDNSISIWDMALEEDAEEVAQHASGAPATGLELPPQLFFIHQGQKHIKEIHWHPQIPATLISTSEDGINIFKPSNLDG